MEAKQLPLSSAEIMKVWNFTSTFLYGHIVLKCRNTFTLMWKELKTQTCGEDAFMGTTCVANYSNDGCLFAV
jgi:hypothetical protein